MTPTRACGANCIQDLDNYFKDPQQQENAHAELRTMILKPNETCEDFFMRYNQIRTEAELTAQHFEAEQLGQLQHILPSVVVRDVQRGYDRHIQDQLKMVNMQEAQHILGAPEAALMRTAIKAQSLGFDKFKNEVIASDRVFRRHLYKHKRNATYRSPYSTTQSTMRAGPSRARHPDDMDIDVNRVDSQGNREKRRDPAEKGCWQCGVEGHQRHNCPERKNGNRGSFKRNEAKKTPNSNQSRIRQLSEVLTSFSQDEMDDLIKNGLVPNHDRDKSDFL